VLVAQDPPRGWLGEIECSYSTIVGRCSAMPTSEMGHSLQGRPSGKFSHVRCDAESGSQFRTLAATLRGRCGLMIQLWV
jgi:hypothetical protein